MKDVIKILPHFFQESFARELVKIRATKAIEKPEVYNHNDLFPLI